MSTVLTLTLIALSLKTTISTRCDSFDNVKITVHPDRGKPYRLTITGCIERAAFNKTIIQAYVKDQNIPKLGPDSVRNMKHLRVVAFDTCGISTIQEGAFRNVPHLDTIKIVNGDLAVVPSGVFSMVPELEMVNLNHNKITRVENAAFGNISTLRRLYCGHNDLREWKREWFTNSTNLQIIDFSFNQIKVLPERAFFAFPKLKEIYFDHNELEAIESEAFKDVSNLDYLGLKHNRLKTIHAKVFPNEIAIQSLTLNANYLNFLSKRIMGTVVVKQLSFDGNPWKCPCLDLLLLWLHQTNASVSRSQNCTGEVPVCSFSGTLPRNCTEVVDDDVTRTYLDEVRRIEEKSCARLD